MTRHQADQQFWEAFGRLAPEIQKLADKNFALLKRDPKHPSLHFKEIGKRWSARVGLKHRALALEASDGFLWH